MSADLPVPDEAERVVAALRSWRSASVHTTDAESGYGEAT